MTDKIIISRKEIDKLLTQLNITHQDLRALLDKAEVSEPIGEMKENGVTWFKQNPHAYQVGTKFYTSPQPNRVAELVESNSNLKSQWMYYQDLLSLNGFDGIADCIYVNKKLQKQVAEREAEIARLKAIT